MPQPGKKVRSGQQLSRNIHAVDWNILLEVADWWRRQKRTAGTGGYTDEIQSNHSVLVFNETGQTFTDAFRVLRITSTKADISPFPLRFSRRPSFSGDVPVSSVDAVAVLQGPSVGTYSSGQTVAGVRAVIGGHTLGRVQIVDPAHQWANPIPGITRYLKSASCGQFRILDYITDPDDSSLALASLNLIGAVDCETDPESGESGDSGSGGSGDPCAVTFVYPECFKLKIWWEADFDDLPYLNKTKCYTLEEVEPGRWRVDINIPATDSPDDPGWDDLLFFSPVPSAGAGIAFTGFAEVKSSEFLGACANPTVGIVVPGPDYDGGRAVSEDISLMWNEDRTEFIGNPGNTTWGSTFMYLSTGGGPRIRFALLPCVEECESGESGDSGESGESGSVPEFQYYCVRVYYASNGGFDGPYVVHCLPATENPNGLTIELGNGLFQVYMTLAGPYDTPICVEGGCEDSGVSGVSGSTSFCINGTTFSPTGPSSWSDGTWVLMYQDPPFAGLYQAIYTDGTTSYGAATWDGTSDIILNLIYGPGDPTLEVSAGACESGESGGSTPDAEFCMDGTLNLYPTGVNTWEDDNGSTLTFDGVDYWEYTDVPNSSVYENFGYTGTGGATLTRTTGSGPDDHIIFSGPCA